MTDSQIPGEAHELQRSIDHLQTSLNRQRDQAHDLRAHNRDLWTALEAASVDLERAAELAGDTATRAYLRHRADACRTAMFAARDDDDVPAAIARLGAATRHARRLA